MPISGGSDMQITSIGSNQGYAYMWERLVQDFQLTPLLKYKELINSVTYLVVIYRFFIFNCGRVIV